MTQTSVYCAVRTESLSKADYVSSLDGYDEQHRVQYAATQTCASCNVVDFTAAPTLQHFTPYSCCFRFIDCSLQYMWACQNFVMIYGEINEK
jgi:hypothetical protein